MEGQSGKVSDQRKGPDKSGIPDLAHTMQAMSLSDPGLCRIQGSQVTKQENLDFSCSLIMKVASTGASTRSLSQKSLEEAMARAWRDKYQGISQVSSSVFLAHFKSQEDLISVYVKQPWVANSENLLLDWFDPNISDATSSSDFKFESILVNVRAYGIPRNKRSISLLKDILNQVGQVSDFHVLQETNIFAKQDYIWGTAKLKVNNPIKDKAAVSFDDGSSLVAYLHYEKIKRICLFCGIMFHNVQDCNLRNVLISERQRHKQACSDIPEHRFGQWITNERMIPVELIQNARMEDQGTSQQGNLILQRLRQMFAEDPKDKGKRAEFPSIMHSQYTAQENQQEYIERLATTNTQGQHEGQVNAQQGNTPPILVRGTDQHEGQSSTQQGRVVPTLSCQRPNEKNFLPESTLRLSIAKRAAPFSEDMSQPQAKRSMATQLHIQNTNTTTAAMNIQNASAAPGILGPAPPKSQAFVSAQNNVVHNKERNKPSRWDPQMPQQTEQLHQQWPTVFMPGTNTWKRNKAAANARRSEPARSLGTAPLSPCRSDATSAIGGSYNHDPWPLHTPTVSSTQGTIDSRLGAFSPPQVAQELYDQPNLTAGVSHQGMTGNRLTHMDTMQKEVAHTVIMQSQDDNNSAAQTSQAEAPAFKAPRAP